MHHRTYFAAVVLILTALGCAPPPAPPVGWNGPLPSVAARRSMGDLPATFTDTTSAWGGGEWTNHGSIVGPTGLVLSISQGATKRQISLRRDADIADLHRRMTGTPRPGIGSGALSPEYEASLDAPK